MKPIREKLTVHQPIPPGHFRQFILITPQFLHRLTVTHADGVVLEVVPFVILGNPFTKQARSWHSATMNLIVDELTALMPE